MKKSLRLQLSALFIGTMVAALVIIVLINQLFLGRFYLSQKTKTIVSTYEKLNTLMSSDGDEEELGAEVQALALADNLQIVIADADFTNIQSTSADAQALAVKLFGYVTGMALQEEEVVLKKTEQYTIQRSGGMRPGMNALELWGTLDSGDLLLVQTPIESIDNAVRLSNIFYLAVGALITLLAVLFILIYAKRLTRPITQLTDLSKQMADLDFDKRYTDHAGNEIDALGENFNRMSAELKDTITELKNANVKLLKDVEEKTQIDKERQEFLNNVSHELKTPISLIRGYAEGLRDGVADDAESRDDYCSVIIDESEKMDVMVRQLLTLNQLESGHREVQMERFDLVELVNGVVTSMQLMFAEAGAQLNVALPPHAYAWGDAFAIEEVVTNYLSNALHHLDGPRIIEVSLREQESQFVLTVFNTGQPIPEEALPHIWEKFYKVDKARTRAYGGSGIGLSIVKAIMDAHGQRCAVQNYENGVAFYCTLEKSR